jgi:hypothetical protein
MRTTKMKKEKNWKTGHDEPLRIEVTIGHITLDYLLVETNAPRRFDEPGTLEFPKDSGNDTTRMILVEKAHVRRQRIRNHSGLFTFETQEDALNPDMMKRFIANRLYERLTRNEEN